MNPDPLPELQLPEIWHEARHSFTSLPWPADRDDFPSVDGPHQIVRLFEEHARPRSRRYLLLTHNESDLPQTLQLQSTNQLPPEPKDYFSHIQIHTLHEALDSNQYVYRECQATISLAGQSIGLRLGLLPNENLSRDREVDAYSWWQWCRAERLWSGPVAEAWRIGGHLVPYTIDTPGRWDRPEMTHLGDLLNRYCGDILHADIYAILWRDGLIQLTNHFKSAYFHTWPKEIPAFPAIYLDLPEHRKPDFSPCAPMFRELPQIRKDHNIWLIRPWNDLRFLANKDKDNNLSYLSPEKPDVFPPGVSRSCWFDISMPGLQSQAVGRYRIPPTWYQHCNVIETNQQGPATQLALRNAKLIRESTQQGGIDTGRVWRYLRRWERLNRPEEDGAEWEGNLAQAMFTLAYQTGESDPLNWQLYLHHAYHAADVSVYHGAWMGRLECTAAFTAPLPKFRFGGFLYGYLETGDPYLLELSRSLAGVYMAMEWALQPRSAIGRDSYPLTCLMSLWDYTADPLYLDFARQMCTRLLSTQQPDGGFSSQAGAGVLTGCSAKPAVNDIHFGSGILAPIALLEWATRDRSRWPADFLRRLRKWADLMLSLQKPDGHWYVQGRSDEPYTLTGSGTLWSLIKASEILNDPRCIEAVRRYLKSMNEATNPKLNTVLGTHAFLSVLYANVADAALAR